MTQQNSALANSSSFTCAIILAAGSGSRMQGHVADKMLTLLNGFPVVCHSVRSFVASGCIQQFTVVYRDEDQKKALEKALKRIDLKGATIDWVKGGERRQDSVYRALLQQPQNCSHVFIHDGARPLVSSDSIRSLYAAVLRDRSATLAHPVTDTIKRISNATGHVRATLADLERSSLWAMETPQAFDRELILKAYEHVNKNGLQITDDTAAVSMLGWGTTLVLNPAENTKITLPEDLDYLAWKLDKR